MSKPRPLIKNVFCDITAFTANSGGLRLRQYQREPAQCICSSVLCQKGLSFVVIFPRQSGKNELQAQIEAYLLSIFHHEDKEIVKISPTFKPQTLNAMRRLERVLEDNILTRDKWEKESGYIYKIEQARMIFLSGSPEANIVGATASLLLEVDEAQEIEIAKFDKDIAPMAASTNATRVFWGTAWTSATLLGRELRAAQAAEAGDGVRRAFVLTADEVAVEVPAYGQFVAAQVARLGRDHPMVRTQFFSEEIDGAGGMFPPERLALMQGDHPPLFEPRMRPASAGPRLRPASADPLFHLPGAINRAGVYCLLVDVAGEDKGATDPAQGDLRNADLKNPGRDATALTVVEVDLESLSDPLIKAPTYRVVHRRQWVGMGHTELYAQLLALAKAWCACWLVVDATGVGAGLASFLSRALPRRVIPFLFNQASKSKLGWNFLSIVDGGRWKEFKASSPSGSGRKPQGLYANVENQEKMQAAFFRQLFFCQYELIEGPGKLMKWGVPDGQRDPSTGELVHDDWITSAALAAVLDEQEWAVGGPALIVKAEDPLKEMDKGW